MNLVVVGLSHHSAPVEVRERVAFPAEEIEPALKRAAELARGGGAGSEGGEAMLVSTCNRVELYLASPASDPRDLRARVAAMLEADRGASGLNQYLYQHAGDGALAHLFRVAASLDSLVVGEPQILGQVKDAWEAAVRAGTVGPLLSQVVPRAFAAAKRVRTETGIARASASIASVAVQLAERIFGDLSAHEVLVVGAGKMGELAARHFIGAGCKRILVCNRTVARGEALAARLREAGAKAEALGWDALPQLLARADLVLSSTGAAEPVLTRELVVRAMKARRGRWLCLLDIAVPRDVEPACGEVDNVYLYDVDALTRVVDENMAERRREADHAERIVAEEVQRTLQGMKALGVVPTIRALRERFTQVAQAEAEKALGKLSGLPEKQQREVQLLAESIVNKLLHAPMTALKREADADALAASLRTLFDLRESAPAEPGAQETEGAGGARRAEGGRR